MTTIKLLRVTTLPDGKWDLVYEFNGNGQGTTYSVKQDALDEITTDPDAPETLRFLLRYWNARNPGMTNTALVLNKTITIDWSAPQMIKVN